MRHKTLWLILILVVMMSEQISAYDFNHTINQSELPKTFFDNITIVTFTNATLNFQYRNFTSGITNVTLNETNEYNLSINVTVPNSTESGNYVTNVTAWAINISNNITTNLTTNISIFIDILNDTTTQFIQIGANTYSYSVCDKDLPFNTSFTTSFATNYNTTSTCDDDIIHCPKDLTTDKTSITINISVPKTILPSTLTRVAKFGVAGKLNNITFVFEILSCITDVSDICKTIANSDDVICDKDLVQSIISRNYTKIGKEIVYINTTNTTIKELVNIEDEDTLDILRRLGNVTKDARLTISRIREIETALVDKDKEISGLRLEKESMTNTIPLLVKQSVSDLSLRYENTSSILIQTTKESWNKNKVILSVFTLTLLTSTIYFGHRYLKNKVI